MDPRNPDAPSPGEPAARAGGGAEPLLSHVRLRPRSDSGNESEHGSDHGAGDESGAEACMVDVGEKDVTLRTALARARVVFPAGLLARLAAGEGRKGSLAALEEVARVAGILAAKRTGDLIPMCHPLALDHVEVTFHPAPAAGGTPPGPDLLEVRCATRCRGRTGVEMEAMVGASVAALTVYDMTKAADKGIRLEAVELLEKTGGKSGTWRRPAPEPS